MMFTSIIYMTLKWVKLSNTWLTSVLSTNNTSRNSLIFRGLQSYFAKSGRTICWTASLMSPLIISPNSKGILTMLNQWSFIWKLSKLSPWTRDTASVAILTTKSFKKGLQTNKKILKIGWETHLPRVSLVSSWWQLWLIWNLR